MKPQYALLALFLAIIGVVSIAGFRGDHFQKPPFEVLPDMNYQDKVKDQQPSVFFADGAAARAPISGTVAEEMPADNSYWATGKWDENHWGTGIPVHDAVDGGRPLQIDAANMARGRERYTISCAVCHGAAGDGQGITSKYGVTGIASYHTDRLRADSDGDIFNTITNGKGQMFGYGYNITIDDRWRIVMYIRALQRSQNAALADATPQEMAQLDKMKKPAAPPTAAPAPAPGSPAPATPPAPAKPAGTTYNENHSGKFSFDVGYAFDSTPAMDLTPASRVGSRLDGKFQSLVLSVNAPNQMSPSSPGSLRFDVRPDVYGLANIVLLDLSFDLGEQWSQPGDVVRFSRPIIGPLRLDYGRPYASNDSSPSYSIRYLSQSTMKGWYDGFATPF